MIEKVKYISAVKEYYSFLQSEFSLKVSKEYNAGNAFYNIEFKGKRLKISISYENIEDYFLITIYKPKNFWEALHGKATKSIRINELTPLISEKLAVDDFNENDVLFSKFESNGSIERMLLKGAKDLRLCLKYA